MLRIENLCAGYGDVDVIHQLSLDVLPNEVVGVLGCNGAGKSTLVKAIMGLLPRASGAVRFLEQPLNGLRTHEIARRGIGLVPQGRWIFPRLTVRENLLMGTQAAGGAGILDEVFDYFRNSEVDSIDNALKDLGSDDYTREELQLMRIKFLSELGN